MSRSYWKLHSQHLNLDLAIFFSCMCNCKQFFQVSHSFHYNTICLMQREAVLHVNCLLNGSGSHKLSKLRYDALPELCEELEGNKILLVCF